jgi:acetylornithine deacetylase/succinyl-diaminopimelate desuccinylase-like protein
VPDEVLFRLDRRVIPEENLSAVETELRDILESTARNYPGTNIEVRTLLMAEPLAPQPGWERLASTFQRNGAGVLGTEIPVTAVPLYTDARHYAAKGIPTVLYGAGPRTLLEANAHNANENLRLDDLRKATKVVALSLADLLTGTE